MDTNDFLRAMEFVYQINVCNTVPELGQVFYYQLGLLIPFQYASYIAITEDPNTHELHHAVSFCKPKKFQKVEEAWLTMLDKAYTKWLSSTRETVIVRDSDLLAENRRFSEFSYQDLFNGCNVYDTMQMSIVYKGTILGRLALYRTKEAGTFSEQDAALLQLLSRHINLAFFRCQGQGHPDSAADRKNLRKLVERCHLTRREEEIVDYMFQGMDNVDISERLNISINTLYKHNNSIFQKCGVKSRWELLTMR